MKGLVCKILREVLRAQELGMIATFEVDMSGEVSVFIGGHDLDSYEYSMYKIYAYVMDQIISHELENETI